MSSIKRCLFVEFSLFTSSAVIYQPMYSPRLLGKNRSFPDFFLRVEGGCAQAINLFTVIIFGDSTFTTDELNPYLFFHSLLAVSSDFSPSTQSDQEAALLAADTSSDVSEVGRFVLCD